MAMRVSLDIKEERKRIERPNFTELRRHDMREAEERIASLAYAEEDKPGELGVVEREPADLRNMGLRDDRGAHFRPERF